MTNSLRRKIRRICCAAVFLASAIFCAGAQVQMSPTLGQVIGDDISVIGPSHVIERGAERAITFGSGGTIVVHSGRALVEFAGGGELEVCGPAKFTVLASGETLTVALSFGRVHAKFNATRPITIYTPLIIATPMAIENQARDATVGLTDTGAMCVLAEHGAVQVQQQLSGATMIVPQPSEVLLQGTAFGATPAIAGSCRCNFDDTSAQKTLPTGPIAQPGPMIAATPSSLSPRNQAAKPVSWPPASSLSSRAPIPREPVAAKAEIVPQHAPMVRPIASATPPVKQPITRIQLPPIGYDAKSATSPAEPISVATLMLAKAADVEPEWIFYGQVAEPPHAARKSQRAAPQHQPKVVKSEESHTAEKAQKEGFWAKFRDFFSGGSQKISCAGAGCG
ncbi:MAG TPA: hypothetical protein VNF02_00685 [Candidatus Limnocylindrales bacterium]|nr:hypothetical protein [Candidatus Limnocylindrales bacterium]